MTDKLVTAPALRGCPAGHVGSDYISAGGGDCAMKCAVPGCGWTGPRRETWDDAIVAWGIRAPAPDVEAALKLAREAVDGFADEVKRAAVARENAGRGGQQVPFHGDFASAPPSTLARLAWWSRRFDKAIAALDGLKP